MEAHLLVVQVHLLYRGFHLDVHVSADSALHSRDVEVECFSAWPLLVQLSLTFAWGIYLPRLLRCTFV